MGLVCTKYPASDPGFFLLTLMFSAKIFVSISRLILPTLWKKSCNSRYNLCTRTVIEFHQLYWHYSKLTLLFATNWAAASLTLLFYLKFKLVCSETSGYSIWATEEALPSLHFIAEHDIIWHGVSLWLVWVIYLVVSLPNFYSVGGKAQSKNQRRPWCYATLFSNS